MSSTLNPTCPLCGLRYTDRSLLDLHIREDHVQRDRGQEHDEPVDARPPQQAPQPAPAPPVSRPGWAAAARRAARTGLDRAIRTLRHAPAGEKTAAGQEAAAATGARPASTAEQPHRAA
jgi:hypothetical protein